MHQLLIMALPPHISKIGLYTGQFYLAGAIYAIYKKNTNLAIICSSIYATTMAHWHNMKNSGIAKTLDVMVVVTGAMFVSFHESYKWVHFGGRKLWNSVLLIGTVSYVANTVVLTMPILPIETEKIQIATAVIHTFWLHVMTNISAMWCLWNC